MKSARGPVSHPQVSAESRTDMAVAYPRAGGLTNGEPVR